MELQPEPTYCYAAELLRVIDGDTIRCRIALGMEAERKHNIRLSGLNTPEPRGHEAVAGKWVTSQVIHWLGGATDLILKSNSYEPDKYGRCLADVWCAGMSLNKWLLDKRYAWPTDPNGSIRGPRSIDLLGLPDQIKAEVRRQQL